MKRLFSLLLVPALVSLALIWPNPALADQLTLDLSAAPLLQFPATGEGGGVCIQDERTLCLLDGVISVTATWKDQRHSTEGAGKVRILGERTGAFWFFQEDNLEILVKALDGRAQNGNYWIFLGSLSDVEFRVEVRHTPTGQSKTYLNPPGNLYGIADVRALDGSSQVCGTIAGIPCPDALFCDLQQGCGVSDAGGICVDVPDACLAVFDPVCGCDAMTYGNDCERQRAGIVKDHDGACSEPDP